MSFRLSSTTSCFTPTVTRKPGHENCEGCVHCGLSVCPDCEIDGRSCIGGAWCAWAPQPIDQPTHRRRPTKRR